MFDLYLITDPETPDVVGATRAALSVAARGRIAVQLRAKNRTSAERLWLGQALREVTREAGAPLLVNGDPDLARELGADGVHLPEGSGAGPVEVRSLLGPGALVGVSCHGAAGLRAASRAGASFVTLSPFAASPGKGPPLGPERFGALAALATVPVVALGGIDASNAAAAMRAGAVSVAVVRAVYRATDPAGATRELLASLDSSRGEAR